MTSQVTLANKPAISAPTDLLRRHDYAVDVLGGATGGQYIEDYHEHGGSLCRIGVAFIRAAPTIENSQNPS
jgi:hypothetical protein